MTKLRVAMIAPVQASARKNLALLGQLDSNWQLAKRDPALADLEKMATASVGHKPAATVIRTESVPDSGIADTARVVLIEAIVSADRLSDYFGVHLKGDQSPSAEKVLGTVLIPKAGAFSAGLVAELTDWDFVLHLDTIDRRLSVEKNEAINRQAYADAVNVKLATLLK